AVRKPETPSTVWGSGKPEAIATVPPVKLIPYTVTRPPGDGASAKPAALTTPPGEIAWGAYTGAKCDPSWLISYTAPGAPSAGPSRNATFVPSPLIAADCGVENW